MLSFILKDLKIMARDRTELIVLLLMPLILIGILGFALRGMFEGNTEALEMQVALVQLDDEEVGIEAFIEDLEESGAPDEQVQALENAASDISPSRLLMAMFENDELEEIIAIVETDQETAESYVRNEEVAAVLTIPEHFTYDSLRKMMLDEGEGSSLALTVTEYGSLRASIFNDVISQFVRELNFETAIAQAYGGELPPGEEAAVGGRESATAADPVSSMQYYALGMAVMFVLYVSSTLSSKAFVEKKQHVFYRILLTGTHPVTYLSGKFISASLIAFLQLAILFSLSAIVFQAFTFHSIDFWLGMAGISAALSLCVGALAALLTALVVRYNNDAISSIFSGGVVSLFAFVGGSFFPTDNMPAFFKFIGSWTPNGAGLAAYVQWLQGYETSVIMGSLLRIAVATVIIIVVSLLIFPRRRSTIV
ncbi:ABC transporter permease [Salipaludibacillus aurantiacus]|uniref:ABC-2 type transport system permease protein n=1 Tax=Salipaludibacillus aurantiacus TaxID=1601833 RepID=A0A1H9U8G9_9BACI|nr:ABC transporter permease [Salipaludibacillus aurantiacus]SES05755.1 ABC-2 type transport system permease protein [Salipaludibacillus aurantiacus]